MTRIRTHVLTVSIVVLIAGCSVKASTSSTESTSDDVVASTTALPATTTTIDPNVLPVPDATPRPSATVIKKLSLGLKQLNEIPHLLGMAWSTRENSFYLITQEGRVYKAPPELTSAELVLDLRKEVSPFIYGSERGMLGVAINPRDGRLFLNFTDLKYDSNVVSFALVNGKPDPASRRKILWIDQPGLSHKAGMMVFDDSGNLWISFGDGGGNKGRTSQDYMSLLGGILRITPKLDAAGYDIPADNPFVNDATKKPELWAKGLRQPHRFSIDRGTNTVYIGDVGENTNEELNIVDASPGGYNFGWYFMEGFDVRWTEGKPDNLTAPKYTYPHTVGVAIIAGYVYHGAAIPGLRGAFVFADMQGKFWALSKTGLVKLDISAYGTTVSSFGEGPDGELYVLSLQGGLKKIVPAK